MDEITIKEIESNLETVLKREHSLTEKHKFVRGDDYIRCACPICGDSEKSSSKKRGNLFFDSGYYHCYNCQYRIPISKFFRNFNCELSSKSNLQVADRIREYLDGVMVKRVNQLSEENVKHLREYAIPKDDIIKKLGLNPMYSDHPYVKDKSLSHKVNEMAYRRDNVYFFNMVNETHVIGFQIRTFNPKFQQDTKYIKYPLSKIYSKFFPDNLPKGVNLSKIDKVSLMYNLMTVDFNKKVTVFEGCSDSWLYPNSIGKSSLNVSDEFLDDITNIRYFFDNDSDGFREMSKKLKMGKFIFLWKKFLKDMELDDPTLEIKDWADIIKYSKKHNKQYYRKAEEYFSNCELDMIYV